MFLKAITLTLLVGLIGGCASVDVPKLTNDHPANPTAEEAPASKTGDVLGKRVGRSPVRDPVDTDHMSNQRHRPKPDGAGERFFTCPMHPEIRGVEGGQCPICNMSLVEGFKNWGSR